MNENEKSGSASIMSNLSDSSQVRMSTAEQFSLTEQAKTFIDQIAKKQIANFNSLQEQPSKKTNKNQNTIVISDSDEKAGQQSDIQDSWVEISGFYLFERDRMILQDDKQCMA